MSYIEQYCNADHGFNFKKDQQDRVGHITSLTLGSKEYAADLQVTVPTAIGGDKVKVVGVLSDVYWPGGHAHPLIFNFRISTTNKQQTMVLRDTELSDTTVKVKFVVYEYDPNSKKYYTSFHSNEKELTGLINKHGGALDINIDPNPAPDVPSPLNYHVSLGVMPDENEQEVHRAVSTSDKYVKKWGVTVTGGSSGG